MQPLPDRLGTKDTGLGGGSEVTGFSKRTLGLQARHSTTLHRPGRCCPNRRDGWCLPLVGATHDPSTNHAADERDPASAVMLEQPACIVSVHSFWEHLSVGPWKALCSTA